MHRYFGDRLAPRFLATGDNGPTAGTPLLMVEARSVFRRRRSHRVDGYFLPSAMRRRAACGRPVSAVFTAVGHAYVR